MAQIVPTPTDEETAAIVAAVEMLWPRPAVEATDGVPKWRFSGRWWNKPTPRGRPRP